MVRYNGRMAAWNIVGHEWAVEHLRRSIVAGHVAHAYLFSGPTAIGKGMLALRFAQALVCERGTGDPCLQCRTCKRVEHGNHSDVRTISLATQAEDKAAAKPEGKTEESKSVKLGIEAVREWQRDIDLRPFEARRRVFILDDADKLTDQAANAMLKTLEEPPPYAVLILIAHGAGDLLPTIVSRCRTLRLRPLRRAEVAAALRERYDIAPSDADVLAAWSAGRLGEALRAAEDPDLVQQQHAVLDALGTLRQSNRAHRLKWAEDQAKDYRSNQASVQTTLLLWQNWWRDVLLLANGCADAVTYVDRRAQTQDIAAHIALPAVHETLQRIEQAREQLADNVNPQLALENLVLHLP
jgi:DNA polymerase III subunit delta'